MTWHIIVIYLSFICLSGFFRTYGLRRFMFLDTLRGDSRRVQVGYAAKINKSFRIMVYFLAPLFIAECEYKALWYYAGGRKIPFLGNPVASDIIACILELASWIYRLATFLLVCFIFRMICHLQILRLQDFALIFQKELEVAAVLQAHLKIRRQLAITSQRFSKFIVASLLLVTSSQFATVLLTTRRTAEVNILNTGELVNLFTAGTDTSSSTVEWALAELIRNPEILKKAQAELDSVVGSDRLVSETDLPNLPFLQSVIKETFRLHPSTPLSLPRISSEACEVNGYHIPQNTMLLE